MNIGIDLDDDLYSSVEKTWGVGRGIICMVTPFVTCPANIMYTYIIHSVILPCWGSLTKNSKLTKKSLTGHCNLQS